MAKLTVLPHQSIINGFKGTIDFYVHKGIPCARRWPRYVKHLATLPEAAAQADFAYIVTLAQTLGTDVIAPYQLAVVGVPYTWRDLFVQGYISGISYQVES